jgi:hypothetical protein
VKQWLPLAQQDVQELALLAAAKVPIPQFLQSLLPAILDTGNKETVLLVQPYSYRD